jgi:hypothetical protein
VRLRCFWVYITCSISRMKGVPGLSWTCPVKNHFPQNSQGPFSLAGNQYPFAVRKQMTDQVDAGMAFAGAGRTLDYNPIVDRQTAHNLFLLFIIG